MSITNDTATIDANVEAASPTGGRLGGQNEVFRSVRIEGTWYFDDYRTADAPGEPESNEIHR